MNNYRFIVLFCTFAVLDAGNAEFVWLRDLNNDAGTRHQNVGLPDELKFQLNGEQKSVNLHLKENPHLRADTDMYIVRLTPGGTPKAVKETVTGRTVIK
ncbi:hypothetical protein ACJMK2_018064 [Sinanodonta woodiana]|uniref:Uncharacterized protein n=1 Tax=Sinanodonta woodiana TaxID=1069815 RepID=A0ABD3UC98_SINWO